jgi:uncharacterized protein (TIGR03067 family)
MAVVFASVAVPALADGKADLKAMAGTWAVDRVEIDGKDVTESFKNISLVLANDTYTATVNGQTDKGTVALAAAQKPKAMDITGTEGPNRGKTFPCVYDLKDDTLTVCYGLDFQTRPTAFQTAKDSGTMLIVYKRKK